MCCQVPLVGLVHDMTVDVMVTETTAKYGVYLFHIEWNKLICQTFSLNLCLHTLPFIVTGSLFQSSTCHFRVLYYYLCTGSGLHIFSLFIIFFWSALILTGHVHIFFLECIEINRAFQ